MLSELASTIVETKHQYGARIDLFLFNYVYLYISDGAPIILGVSLKILMAQAPAELNLEQPLADIFAEVFRHANG